MRRSLLALPLVLAAGFMADKPSAKALNLVCSAGWSGNVSAPGTSNPAPLTGSIPPCPVTTTNATVTVGSSGGNAGTVNSPYDWGSTSGSSNYPTTSLTSIDLGSAANSTQSLTLSFSQAVANPLLYFGFFDNNTSFIFSQAFSLLQANNAVKSSSTTVSGTAGSTNSSSDGFTVQVSGTFDSTNPLVFQYANTTSGFQSVTFTTGVLPVPAPLPILGAGVAFRFSRRLRRRVQDAK
jgi:hypothetical protein